MTRIFTRADTSVLGRWWWTVDRWTLAALAVLIAIGMMLTVAASPSVAEHIGTDPFHFVRRQMLFLPLTVAIVLGLSLMSPLVIRRGAVFVYLGALVLMGATLIAGSEVKGATRWIAFGGFTLQASELMKPAFAVVTAWMLAAHREDPTFPGQRIAAGLLALTAALLLAQPDFGMTVVVTAVWCGQLFLAGMSLLWIAALGLLSLGGMVVCYYTIGHVQYRVDHFLDPTPASSYQITKALRAFQNGQFFGRGPGEGRIKEVLPDAHTDFIFAVAGEEYGLILCLLLLVLFAFIVLRGFSLVMRDENLFSLVAVGGLLSEFGIQAFVNMASSLRMIPTKGMTLPFVSYGGSSLLGLALAMGAVLALTRRHPGGSLT